VSAALKSDGVPRQALLMARALGTIALSAAVREEILSVLARPKIAAVLLPDQRAAILEIATCWTSTHGAAFRSFAHPTF